MSDDSLGDRMKLAEMMEAGRKSLQYLPVLIRLDGKGFSKFTEGLARPYDERLHNLMIETCKCLLQETSATISYTQSDEISLSLYSNDYKSQIYFDGKFQKICSVLAAKCSVFFNKNLAKFIPEKADKNPVFDCRVWQVATLEEGANCYLWRELDASKNSISMAARHYFEHAELQDKNGAEMQEMLFQKHGVNWNNYPDFFKRGSFIQRKVISSKFTAEELDKLPVKHQARSNPDLVIERTEYRRIDMPKLNTVTNRVGVLFFGEDPVVA